MRYINSILILSIIVLLNIQLLAQDSTSAHKTNKDSSNFFLISGIKSISGTIPEKEFFDLHAKFQFDSSFFALASFDIALTDVKSDTAKSSTEKLTEASLYISWILEEFNNDNRALFFGPMLKIFNTVPYWGVHLGSIENKGKLYTSYFILGYMNRFYPADQEENKSPTEHNSNIYIEFALKASEAPFISNLRIKGGVLFPIKTQKSAKKPNIDDMVSRIVLEIPIGKVFNF